MKSPRRRTDLFNTAPLPVAELDDSQRLACLRLIRSENVGPITFRELINRYGGAGQALDALPELSRRAGHGKPIRICPREYAERELEAADACGAVPVFTIEPGYPAQLAQLEAPPPLVYLRGNAAIVARPAVAIVGARMASAAGMKIAATFANELGASGLVIVSGLARGIDAKAHEAALETGTVAVLAGGVDNIYPPENADLHAAIAERGCLVSEMPCGFKPRGQDFPRRNRLISGMSLGVVVVEAARRSGTLSTARRAAEQNREVFAVPGHPLDPRAEGTNHLLKTGAILVTEAADVISHLRPLAGAGNPGAFRETAPVQSAFDTSPVASAGTEGTQEPSDAGNGDDGRTRARLLSALGPAPCSLDDLAETCGISIREVRTILIELDLAGLTERHGAQLVSLRTDSVSTTE